MGVVAYRLLGVLHARGYKQIDWSAAQQMEHSLGVGQRICAVSASCSKFSVHPNKA